MPDYCTREVAGLSVVMIDDAIRMSCATNHGRLQLAPFNNWMTTCLRSCDMNAIGDAAYLWSSPALHGNFASVDSKPQANINII